MLLLEPHSSVSVPINITINEENLTVILLETYRTDENATICNQIYQHLGFSFKLRIYAIVICQSGSFPRMIAASSAQTEFSSSYSGFTMGIVQGALPPTVTDLPPICYHSRRTGSLVLTCEPLDAENCKRSFLTGDLFITHISMNLVPEIVGPITMTLLQWDDPGYIRNRRPLQIASNINEVQVLDDLSARNLQDFATSSHILEWRASQTPEETAYILLDSRGRESKIVTFKKLSAKAYSIATFLMKKKGLVVGDHVVVMMTLSLEFMYTIHACLYCGLIPIPIR